MKHEVKTLMRVPVHFSLQRVRLHPMSSFETEIPHLHESGLIVSKGHAALQVCNPSPHVCSNCMLPGRPHCPSQDPPLAQQVSPPLLGTHVRHPDRKNEVSYCRNTIKRAVPDQKWVQHLTCVPSHIFLQRVLTQPCSFLMKKMPHKHKSGSTISKGHAEIQALNPSAHVCSNCVSSGRPHLPSQDAP